MLKFSELKNRAVVDLNDARKIGNLDNLLVDPTSFQVSGLRLKAGLFSSAELLRIAMLRSVGPDAITVCQPEGEVIIKGESTDQFEENSNLDPSLAKLPDLKILIGLQIVSQAGSLLGEVTDVLLDQNNLTITGYEVSQPNLFSKKFVLPATAELNIGPTMIIVPDQVISQMGVA